MAKIEKPFKQVRSLFRRDLLSRIKFRLMRFYHEKIVFKFASKETVFTSIWHNNYWGDTESLSGPGSSLIYTKTIREELPNIFDAFAIKSVFDAPCGDFNWMKLVLKESNINYIGADIVKGIIEKNILYETDLISFVVHDITKDKFPKTDLWICRDILFHLSYIDILSALVLFIESDTPFLLTSTHINLSHFKNKNIRTGDFRMIDLFGSPFNFPLNVLHRFDDYIEPQPPRIMCLFSREQILHIMPSLRLEVKI